MISRVPPSALSDLRSALRLAGPTRPLAGVHERRAARAAARGHRAAPHQSAAPPGLGRPRGPSRADPAPAGKAADVPPAHPRHGSSVAPPPGHPEVDLPEPERPVRPIRRPGARSALGARRAAVPGQRPLPGWYWLPLSPAHKYRLMLHLGTAAGIDLEGAEQGRAVQGCGRSP
jgi:hypothetical protein